GRLLDTQIHDLVAVVAEDDIDQILADVVHIALHRGQDDGSLLGAVLLFHLRFKVGDRLLHDAGRVEHRRQLHFAGAKQVAHGLHAVEQDCIDNVERRVRSQRVVKNLLQGLAIRALPQTFFTVDDAALQLVFNGERLHGRNFRLRLLVDAREMTHVNLQRIAGGFIEVDELARQVNLDLRDLIERIDLGVVHNRHVKTVVYGLFHEDAVEHAPRVGVQPKRNVAHAQDGLDLRKLLLDPLDGVQRLHAGGTVLFLAGRNRKRQGVKDQV